MHAGHQNLHNRHHRTPPHNHNAASPAKPRHGATAVALPRQACPHHQAAVSAARPLLHDRLALSLHAAASGSSDIAGPGTVPAYRPSLSRRSSDIIPPLGTKTTGLLRLGEGHWCLRQDLILTENIYLNTHILRLRSGGLLMVNPPAVTEEAVALLRSVTEEAAAATGGGGSGQVEHVVLLNLSPEHWYNASDWAPYLAPSATLWTVPGLLQGRSTAGQFNGPERVRQMKAVYGRVLELPDFGPLPGLQEEVEVATFNEPWGFFSESVLWLGDHRAVVFADMAFAVYDHPTDGALLLQTRKLTGIYHRLGCPIVYVMLRKDPRVARAWLDRVLSWDVDKVLASHFDPMVPDGAAELRRCFGFLLEQ